MPEVKVLLREVGPSRSEANLPRRHKTLVDRPEAKGGADKGPIGGEHLVHVAENGCIMVTTLRRGVDFSVSVGTAPPA